jgi:branched-chain amino acid transport system ATP-binding protein
MGVAYVPQGVGIFQSMSVRENFELSCVALGYRQNRRESINMVLDLIPALSSSLDRLAGELSGGQQRLVAIGRCLAMSPKLLLLDEPTAGLFPEAAEQILNALESAWKGSGMTVIAAEQRIDLIRPRVNRLIGIREGSIAMDCHPETVSDATILRNVFGVDVPDSGP